MGILCVPTDSGHLEVLNSACSKIPTFSAITTPHSFTSPKSKAGTVANAHWSLMCNSYLPFCVPITELLRIISTHANFLTLFITEWLGLTESMCGLYSLVTLWFQLCFQVLSTVLYVEALYWAKVCSSILWVSYYIATVVWQYSTTISWFLQQPWEIRPRRIKPKLVIFSNVNHVGAD